MCFFFLLFISKKKELWIPWTPMHTNTSTHTSTNRHPRKHTNRWGTFCTQMSINKLRNWVLKRTVMGNTYHWFQLAKWMECWEKFSFITSFSKGLIGYSLRYSREREAAVCMSGIVGWVEGVQGSSAGEELRTRQTGEYIREAEGEDSTYSGILKAWLVTRWKIKMLFTPLTWFFERMTDIFKMWKVWRKKISLMRCHS